MGGFPAESSILIMCMPFGDILSIVGSTRRGLWKVRYGIEW